MAIFQIHNLSKYLTTYKIKVTVCTTDKGNSGNVKNNTKEIIDGVEVFILKTFSKFYISLNMFSFVKNINKYELVHIHSIFNFPTAISLIFSKLFNKIILSPRGILDKELIENKNTILKILVIYLIKFSQNKLKFSCHDR